MWFPLTEDKPETGREVLGYNPQWVHADYNPEGICLCHRDDDGDWTVAVWCGQCDEWHTRTTDWSAEQRHHRFETPVNPPTHWKYKDRKIM